MLKNYMKILIHSMKRQSGLVTLNFVALVLSMVVIAVILSSLLLEFDSNNFDFKSGELFLLKEKKENGSYSSIFKYRQIQKAEKLFANFDLCKGTFPSVAPINKNFQREEFRYSFINESYSRRFKLKIVEGSNLQHKHFEEGQTTAVISKNLSEKLFDDESGIGKYLYVYSRKYKIVGIFETLIKKSGSAECYIPWNSSDFFKYRLSQIYICSDDKNAQVVLENQIRKHAEKPDNYQIESIDASISRRNNRYVSPVIVVILLTLILPALLLASLTRNRMEVRLLELGVRRAFGATAKTISLQLIFENMVFTFIAGIASLIFSQYFISASYYGFNGSFLRFSIPANILLLVLLVFVLFGLVTGILPAYKVSKKAIVKSLSTN